MNVNGGLIFPRAHVDPTRRIRDQTGQGMDAKPNLVELTKELPEWGEMQNIATIKGWMEVLRANAAEIRKIFAGSRGNF